LPFITRAVHDVQIDRSRWSGDGSFTQLLIDALSTIATVRAIRVEDAPSARTETGYNFIANEIFVTFERRLERVRARWLGLIPVSKQASVPAASLSDLEPQLTADQRIGEADYSDGGMIQYLRTERVVAPYQTRGIKVIELIRIYEAGATPR
jgi:hypothetical protein